MSYFNLLLTLLLKPRLEEDDCVNYLRNGNCWSHCVLASHVRHGSPGSEEHLEFFL